MVTIKLQLYSTVHQPLQKPNLSTSWYEHIICKLGIIIGYGLSPALIYKKLQFNITSFKFQIIIILFNFKQNPLQLTAMVMHMSREGAPLGENLATLRTGGGWEGADIAAAALAAATLLI